MPAELPRLAGLGGGQDPQVLPTLLCLMQAPDYWVTREDTELLRTDCHPNFAPRRPAPPPPHLYPVPEGSVPRLPSQLFCSYHVPDCADGSVCVSHNTLSIVT